MAPTSSYVRLIRREWRFLGFGFALTFFSSLGQTYYIFVFNDEIRGAFGLSDGDYGFCYALATLGSAFTLVHVGRAIDRVSLSRWTCLVCLAAIGACFLMSVVHSTVMLVLALFALRFTGQGLLGHTAFTSMGRYYDRNRGRAVSIAALGFAAGNAIFPWMGVALLSAMPWREAWALLGSILLLVMIPLSLWLLRGHKARHARHTADLAPGQAADVRSPHPQWTRRQVLRDPRFFLLLPGVLSPTFILTGLIFHQRRLAEQKGWTIEWIATCFIAYAVAVLVSSLLTGRAVDDRGARRLAAPYLLPLAVGLVVLAVGTHSGAAMLYLVLMGLTAGAAGPVVGSLWAELYGVLHLGSIRALATSLMVVSTALAPFLLGWLLDQGVSMEVQAWGCLVYVLLGMIGITLALRLPAQAPR